MDVEKIVMSDNLDKVDALIKKIDDIIEDTSKSTEVMRRALVKSRGLR